MQAKTRDLFEAELAELNYSSIGDSLPIAFQVFFCDFFGRDKFVMLFGADPDSAIGLLKLK